LQSIVHFIPIHHFGHDIKLLIHRKLLKEGKNFLRDFMGSLFVDKMVAL